MLGVSDDYSHVEKNSTARDFLNKLAEGQAIAGQTMFGELESGDEYENSLLNFSTVVSNPEVYNGADTPKLFNNVYENGLFADGDNTSILSEAAAQDSNYYGPGREAANDGWEGLSEDSAAAWVKYNELQGRLNMGSQLGLGIEETMTPENITTILDFIRNSSLNDIIQLEKNAYNDDKIRAYDTLDGTQKYFVQSGQDLGKNDAMELVESNKGGSNLTGPVKGVRNNRLAQGLEQNKNPENEKPPKVTAEAEIDGQKITGTNQTARDPSLADANKPTLIGEQVQAKIDKKPGKDLPNGNMATAHAEVEVIQKAYDQGLTNDRDMKINVEGEPVCTYCKTDLRKMADESGLKKLEVYEAKTGKTFVWERNINGKMGKVKEK